MKLVINWIKQLAWWILLNLNVLTAAKCFAKIAWTFIWCSRTSNTTESLDYTTQQTSNEQVTPFVNSIGKDFSFFVWPTTSHFVSCVPTMMVNMTTILLWTLKNALKIVKRNGKRFSSTSRTNFKRSTTKLKWLKP